MICFAKKEDAIEIAKIHKEEIKEGFLSSLPKPFLEKLYICVIENDFCVLAKENNEVVGFMAGTVDIKKLYSFFIKRYFIYSVVFFLPKIFDTKKIIENIFYIKKEKISPELLTVALKKNFQGRGLAKGILKLFVSEMEERGVKVFKVVVGERLKPAINFYEKNGFKFLKQTEVHKGKKSIMYIYHL